MSDRIEKPDYKILLVDDDPFILSGTGRVLENEGYSVERADSGEAALDMLEKASFDLVLTDLVMGKVGGMQVLIETKQRYPETMVIILTGYADMKAAINAIQYGSDDLMLKPAESEEIFFRVKRCLENKELKDKVRQHTAELEQVNAQLKKDIREREYAEKKLQKANEELNDSLIKLKYAQESLIRSEKLASLGGLVSGVVHEINTPVGIGITASSFIMQQIKKIQGRYEAGEMTEAHFRKFLNTAYESSSMISSNLGRAGELISNFKQVSVDQASEKPRRIIVDEYIKEVLLSLRMELRKTSHDIEVNCPGDLIFNSRPGALAQILTNVVMNAKLHAFEGIEQGKITFDISTDNGFMCLKYRDNGVGMNEEILKHVFDPFYTTKRDQGGSGLGMYIVYNLVTQALNGSIDCESSPGKGTCFTITVPLDNWPENRLS